MALILYPEPLFETTFAYLQFIHNALRWRQVVKFLFLKDVKYEITLKPLATQRTEIRIVKNTVCLPSFKIWTEWTSEYFVFDDHR